MTACDKHLNKEGGVETPPSFSCSATILGISLTASIALHCMAIYGLTDYIQTTNIAPPRQEPIQITLASGSRKISQLMDTMAQNAEPLPDEQFMNATPAPTKSETTGGSSTQYIAARDLDTPPKNVVFFNFFGLMLPQTAQGKITITLWISPEGKIDFLEVEESNVPDELVKSILAQRKNLEFTPGKFRGNVVGSIIKYELTLAPSPPKHESKQLITP